jgi:hypothetical protein
MNDELALKEARIMYRRHGREAHDGVATELADAILRSACGSCALEAVRSAGNDGAKPLTVPMLRSAVHDRMELTSHLNHIAASEREDEVSKAETFWRSKGADAIAAALDIDPTSAKFLAAKMWASGAVPAHPSQIADEFDPIHGATKVWSAHFGVVGGVPVSADAMEKAFDVARSFVLEGAA